MRRNLIEAAGLARIATTRPRDSLDYCHDYQPLPPPGLPPRAVAFSGVTRHRHWRRRYYQSRSLPGAIGGRGRGPVRLHSQADDRAHSTATGIILAALQSRRERKRSYRQARSRSRINSRCAPSHSPAATTKRAFGPCSGSRSRAVSLTSVVGPVAHRTVLLALSVPSRRPLEGNSRLFMSALRFFYLPQTSQCFIDQVHRKLRL
jgi:hypothetical protein